jgi:DNA-binding response OmpR family regulator
MNILYIEDDENLANVIKSKLISKYNVDLATSIKEGCQKFDDKEYDLIITDYFLPDGNGLDVCKYVRENNLSTPILVLTINESRLCVIESLDAGADDYLTKPFSFSELDARIRALIRRVKITYKNKAIVLGELKLDMAKQAIYYGCHLLNLSRQEHFLAKYLLINQQRIVSREELYEHVWGNNTIYNSNTIDVHIRRIRNKIKKYSSKNYIKSIYGLGYKIDNN